MKYMTHNDIRNTWIRFFESKGHKLFPSAPLVPINDDSLLWINAGVTPLKRYFDGTETPESRRIVNIQKCIRTNDIENVGITKRHQTNCLMSFCLEDEEKVFSDLGFNHIDESLVYIEEEAFLDSKYKNRIV